MSLQISVRGGTVNSEADLCATCAYGSRMRTTENRTVTKCVHFGMLRSRIAECSAFHSIKQPHGLLYQTAWSLNRDVNTGETHFYHPDDMSWNLRKPAPTPPRQVFTPPPKISWRRRLRSKAHSWLDKALRPVMKRVAEAAKKEMEQ